MAGCRATIRFIGYVPSTDTSTMWLGVEWDDASRGKHSGEHKGVQYFSTFRTGAGSFIKQDSKTINRRRDFVEVLKEKYLANSGGDKVAFGGDESLTVETVGWDKIERVQSRLHLLEAVGLMETDVGFCRVPGSILETCCGIIDLDLSKNLVGSWIDIASIAVELPLLSSLRLNNNRISKFEGFDAKYSACFAQLNILSLNYTLITFDEIEKLEPFLPSLTELHLRHNEISVLSHGTCSGFKKLTLLYLEDNLIADYKQIEKLKFLPSLKSLILEGNTLSTITPAKSEFTSLEFININRNLIADWTSIHNLNTYPSLSKLRVKQNPITDSIDNPERLHFHLIARLSHAKLMNGSLITARTRRDAEVYYLNECVSLKESLGVTFASEHPRYRDICDIYGEPERGSGSIAKTVADGLVALGFIWEGVETVKRLPLGMNVRSVKSVVKRICKVSRGKVVLETHVDGVVVRLSDDMKDLTHYDVKCGMMIVVSVE